MKTMIRGKKRTDPKSSWTITLDHLEVRTINYIILFWCFFGVFECLGEIFEECLNNLGTTFGKNFEILHIM